MVKTVSFIPQGDQQESYIRSQQLANILGGLDGPRPPSKSVGEAAARGAGSFAKSFFGARQIQAAQDERMDRAKMLADILAPAGGGDGRNAQLAELLGSGAVDPGAFGPAVMDRMGFGPKPEPIFHDIYDEATGRETKTVSYDGGRTWEPFGGVKTDTLSRAAEDQKARIAEAGASRINVGASTGQEAADKAYGQEDYQSEISGVGPADREKQINQLDEALGILEQGEGVTGGLMGLISDTPLEAWINPEGAIAREYVEEVVQRNLREILGAQFTEREGTRLIKRAYNPYLPPAENAKRVRRLIQQIKTIDLTKKAARDYFEANGTLVGFEGIGQYEEPPPPARPDATTGSDQTAPWDDGAEVPRLSLDNADTIYDTLPSGAEFIDPDGVRRRKP